jgi:large subunit ribosomal protein L9
MKVYLKRDVPGLGKANEVKDVSDGYARNYLIPHDLAVPATQGFVRKSKKQKVEQVVSSNRRRQRSEEIAEILKSEPLRFVVKAGETGRLYGSVTSADIAKAISRVIKADFDKRRVLLEHSIREVGIYVIDLKLDEGVRAKARVVVETEA